METAKPGKSRSGRGGDGFHPATSEFEYTDEELQFMRAVDKYKRDNKRPFPTWSEVLQILKSLGYRKSPYDPE